jgi:hypothetical protein
MFLHQQNYNERQEYLFRYLFYNLLYYLLIENITEESVEIILLL